MPFNHSIVLWKSVTVYHEFHHSFDSDLVPLINLTRVVYISWFRDMSCLVPLRARHWYHRGIRIHLLYLFCIC